MEYPVDSELRQICKEIQIEAKTEHEWAAIESSDWFQTTRYCGGFDGTDMMFAFSASIDGEQFCFGLPLSTAILIADGTLTTIDIQSSLHS